MARLGQCEDAVHRQGESLGECYVESFSGRSRDELLDPELFLSLAAARPVVDRWRLDYNCHCPHSSLNCLTPAAFAARYTASAPKLLSATPPATTSLQQCSGVHLPQTFITPGNVMLVSAKTNAASLDNPFWKRRVHGDVVFVSSMAAIENGNEDAYTSSLCRWQPPYQIGCKLPKWFDLTIECLSCSDGIRRFTPLGSGLGARGSLPPSLQVSSISDSLTLVAAVGGHLLLDDQGQPPMHPWFTFHEARLYQEYIRHRSEYLGPTRQLANQINVASTAQIAPSFKNILPEDLGVGKKGSRTPWSTAHLLGVGREVARAMGIENADPQQVFRLALREAAKINPLCLRRSEILRLVRRALFATTCKVTPKHIKYVAKHVRKSLHEACLDTPDALNRWIEDPDSNLLHRISKRDDCTIDRQQVKSALLELGWQSFEVLAQCIDAQMRAFRDTLPVPLTTIERDLFAQTYLHNRQFGLPLIMLHDRLDFLRESILDVWNSPGDRDAVAVVHTMLHLYSTILDNRRAGDRITKRAQSIRSIADSPKRHSASSDRIARPELFAEIARRLAMDLGYDCDFETRDFEANSEPAGDHNLVVFRLVCPDTNFDETITVTRADFEQMARAIARED